MKSDATCDTNSFTIGSSNYMKKFRLFQKNKSLGFSFSTSRLFLFVLMYKNSTI